MAAQEQRKMLRKRMENELIFIDKTKYKSETWYQINKKRI